MKIMKAKKIRFWIGILASMVFVMILFIPEVSPVVDIPVSSRQSHLLSGSCWHIGWIDIRNGIKGGVKPGFYWWIID